MQNLIEVLDTSKLRIYCNSIDSCNITSIRISVKLQLQATGEGICPGEVEREGVATLLRLTTKAAKYTEWEMRQLYEAGRLGTVNFVNRAGEAIANPFK